MLKDISDRLERLYNGEIAETIKLALPLVVVQLIESIYSLTDTYFVSGLGGEALAGVGVAGYLTWLLGVFISLFQTPLSILASQHYGAKKYREIREISGNILLFSMTYSTIVSLLFYWFCSTIVSIQSGLKGVAFIYAVDYLRIRALGFIIFTFSLMLDTLIIATGRTAYSLISHVVGALINIVLDPLLIYGLYGLPRLEVAGAAIATVIASINVIPIQLYIIKSLNLIPTLKSLDIKVFKQAVSLGLPAFIERLTIALGNNVYAGFIARLGEVVMAAHNIGLRIESIVYMPGFAFMLAATTLVGHRVGRGEMDQARSVGLRTIHLGSMVMAIVGASVAVAGPYLVSPFSPSQEVKKLASTYLLLAGFSELGLGLAMVSSGAIRGAGETRIPFYANSLSIFGVRVALTMALTPLLGAIGPWLAMFIDVYIRGTVLYLVFRYKFSKFARKLT